jgi:hypothetical protein
MKLVETTVQSDQITYVWERDVMTASGPRTERCTVTVSRHSDESGIPERNDERWTVVLRTVPC